MRNKLSEFVILASVAMVAGSQAFATVEPLLIVVKKSERKMYLYTNGAPEVLDVAIGREGHGTPAGNYRPTLLVPRIINQVHQVESAVFFKNGLLIGANSKEELNKVGERSTGGSVILKKAEAKYVYDLVNRVGKDNTVILIAQ